MKRLSLAITFAWALAWTASLNLALAQVGPGPIGPGAQPLIPGADFTLSGATLNLAQRTTHGNSNYTILSTDRYIVTNASLSAPRVWTLPLASSLPAGTLIIVQDEAGGVTSTNTIAVTPAGSDTVNGANNATSSTIGVAYGGLMLKSFATGYTVVANTILQACSAPSNNFMIGVSSAGACLFAQPSFANLAGAATPTQLPLATTGAFGAVKPDGSTITISGGVISAVSGGAGTVTNAANLTDKAVVVGDGGTTGVKTLASLGNSGDVLTSNGAGSLPSFQTPSGGGSGALTLVQSLTASNSASLHFASLGASTSLNQYKLICRNLVPATNAVNMLITFGQSGTEKTSGYKWGWHYVVMGGAEGNGGGSTSDSSIQIANNQSSTNGMHLLEATFDGLGSAVRHSVVFQSYSSPDGGIEMHTAGGGSYGTDTTAINDIYVKFSSGNITSGKCSLFSYSE